MENRFTDTGTTGYLYGETNTTAVATRATAEGQEQIALTELEAQGLQLVATPAGITVPYEETKNFRSVYNSRLPTPPLYVSSPGIQQGYGVGFPYQPQLGYTPGQGCNVTYTFTHPTTIALPINQCFSPPEEPMDVVDSDMYISDHRCRCCISPFDRKPNCDDIATSTYDLKFREYPQELHYTAYKPLTTSTNMYRKPQVTSDSRANVEQILDLVIDRLGQERPVSSRGCACTPDSQDPNCTSNMSYGKTGNGKPRTNSEDGINVTSFPSNITLNVPAPGKNSQDSHSSSVVSDIKSFNGTLRKSLQEMNDTSFVSDDKNCIGTPRTNPENSNFTSFLSDSGTATPRTNTQDNNFTSFLSDSGTTTPRTSTQDNNFTSFLSDSGTETPRTNTQDHNFTSFLSDSGTATPRTNTQDNNFTSFLSDGITYNETLRNNCQNSACVSTTEDDENSSNMYKITADTSQSTIDGAPRVRIDSQDSFTYPNRRLPIPYRSAKDPYKPIKQNTMIDKLSKCQDSNKPFQEAPNINKISKDRTSRINSQDITYSAFKPTKQSSMNDITSDDNTSRTNSQDFQDYSNETSSTNPNSESKASVENIIYSIIDEAIEKVEGSKYNGQKKTSYNNLRNDCNKSNLRSSKNNSTCTGNQSTCLHVHFDDSECPSMKVGERLLTALASSLSKSLLQQQEQSTASNPQRFCDHSNNVYYKEIPPSPSRSWIMPNITFHELNENLNMWFLDLVEDEHVFLNQVSEVNNRDIQLVASRDKIILLREMVKENETLITILEAELRLAANQGNQIENYINYMRIDSRPLTSLCDAERCCTYNMVENTYLQMMQTTNNYRDLMSEFNLFVQEDNKDVVGQIAKILNRHTHTLYSIEFKMNLMTKELNNIYELQKYFASSGFNKFNVSQYKS